uniref:Ig-like domain-containing protein n=1 Tax=Astyanax mexicanus TaxID=7994 RepID=A0A3B1K2F8_ASTMX
KTSNDDLQVQTEKTGENVTIKCEESFIKDNHQYSFAWYKQSYGKLPQLVVRLVNNNSNVRHNRQFQHCLNINETTDVTEFGSGTLLIFNDTDALNYAAIQFRNKPPPSRTPRVQESQDIYSQVKVR